MNSSRWVDEEKSLDVLRKGVCAQAHAEDVDHRLRPMPLIQNPVSDCVRLRTVGCTWRAYPRDSRLAKAIEDLQLCARDPERLLFNHLLQDHP